MPERVRFYLDQHISFAVAQGLRQRGVDVLSAQDAGRCGFSDSNQLEFATRDERVMVSFDDDYLALASSGAHHAGIAWCRYSKLSIGQLVSALLLIHGILSLEEMRDRVEFL